jgi:tetratricopeptide (TPR) repeat protein
VQGSLLRRLSELNEGELPAPIGAVVAQLAATISPGRSDVDIREWVSRVRRELQRIDAYLAEFEQQVAEREAEAATDQQFDAPWWRGTRRRIGAVRRNGREAEAVAEWLAAWALALSADEFDLCLKIARSRVAAPPRHYADAMGRIAHAARDGYGDDLRADLRLLTADEQLLRVESAGVLGGVLARVLSGAGAHEEAAAAAEQLFRWLEPRADSTGMPALTAARCVRSGQSVEHWRALALAVAAEIDLARGDVKSARWRLDRATATSQPPPDVFIGAAMVAEGEQFWLRADACCDQALDRGADPTRWALGMPIPARLRLRAASRIGEADPAKALEQVQAALASGIVGEGEYPETDVILQEAALLERLCRYAEASSELIEAANRFLWSGVTSRALDIYERASALPDAPASAWWSYAEALRLEALTPHDTVDLPMMRRAEEAMARGLELGEPGPEDAWVLVTHGMIADSIDPTATDGLVFLERALLHDEDYVLPYGFLAMSLRRHGFLGAALTAAEQGASADATNEFLRDHFISLLFDHGEYERGLEYVDGQRAQYPDAVPLAIDFALFQLRTGDTEAAMRTLEGLPRDDSVRVALGACYAAAGDWQQSRREFDVLWRRMRGGSDPVLAGWAAFQTGRLDEAIDLYTEIARKAPSHTSYCRDLGLMCLVRGDSGLDDLARGEDLLRGGIQQAVSLDELFGLQTVDFATVRANLADAVHASAVEDVLVRLGRDIQNRRTELLNPPKLPDALWGRLCRAREAPRGGDPHIGFLTYLDLLTESQIPAAEAGLGLSRTTMALFAEADQIASAGDLDDARRLWTLLDRATAHIEYGDALAVALAARRTVAAIVRGDESPAAHLERALEHSLGVAALNDAIELFADHRLLLWQIYDGLTELGSRASELPDWQRATLAALACQLPLETSYRLRRQHVPSKETTRVLNALDVRLGVGHDPRNEAVKRGIADLRERLAEEMGVRIPSIRRTAAGDIPPGQVDFCLYGQVVNTRSIDPTGDRAADEVLKALDQTLRMQLHRLLGPDDVRLWLADWTPPTLTSSVWEPPDAAVAVRLVRVLRMLLREGVPVGDRARILDAFLAAGPVDKQEKPLMALRAVRRALGASAMGLRPQAHILPLPEDLERRIAAPLCEPDHARWEADRDETWHLVNDLRGWLGQHSTDGETEHIVLVQDPTVRPFAWRLLTGERARVRVLAQEELQ